MVVGSKYYLDILSSIFARKSVETINLDVIVMIYKAQVYAI